MIYRWRSDFKSQTPKGRNSDVLVREGGHIFVPNIWCTSLSTPHNTQWRVPFPNQNTQRAVDIPRLPAHLTALYMLEKDFLYEHVGEFREYKLLGASLSSPPAPIYLIIYQISSPFPLTQTLFVKIHSTNKELFLVLHLHEWLLYRDTTTWVCLTLNSSVLLVTDSWCVWSSVPVIGLALIGRFIKPSVRKEQDTIGRLMVTLTVHPLFFENRAPNQLFLTYIRYVRVYIYIYKYINIYIYIHIYIYIYWLIFPLGNECER